MDWSKGCIHNHSEDNTKILRQIIVYRFGVHFELTVDNIKKFDNQEFGEFCTSIGTRAIFALVYHPQSNRVMERENGKILIGIKKRLLEDKKGKWAEQLPEVLWALNTTESSATGFTPFRLMYGARDGNREFLVGF
jgi:transposase InsO family protein